MIVFFRKSVFEKTITTDEEKDDKKAQHIDENEEFELKVEINDKNIIQDNYENQQEEMKEINLE